MNPPPFTGNSDPFSDSENSRLGGAGEGAGAGGGGGAGGAGPGGGGGGGAGTGGGGGGEFTGEFTMEPATELIELPPGRLDRVKQVFQRIAWPAFAIFCLIGFTLMKFPEEKLSAFVDSKITGWLSSQGIGYSVGESHLSVFPRIKYTLKNVSLQPVNAAVAGGAGVTQAIKLQEMEVYPRILAYLFGRTSARVILTQGSRTLNVDFSQRKTSSRISFQSHGMKLSDLGLPGVFVNVQIDAAINGEGQISGELDVPSTLDGKLNLKLSHILMEPQTIMGFSIPKVSLSEANVDVVIEKSKAIIKNLSLGKVGNASDDLQATAQGDVTLGKTWAASILNVRVNFSIGAELAKSFVLLDAILGPGKQEDGSYAYQLTGPVMAPIPAPIPGGAKTQ